MRKVFGLALMVLFVCALGAAGETPKVKPIIKNVYNIAFINKAHGAPWYVALESSVIDEAKKIAQENNVTINILAQECRYDGNLMAQNMKTLG